MQQQIDLEDKGRELDNKRAQTAKRKAEAVKEMLEAKTADLLRLCNAEADKMMEGDSKNIFAEMNKMKVCTWGVALDKVAVGNECVETEKSKTTNTDNSSDNTKKENYIERNCTEIAGFDLNKKILGRIQSNDKNFKIFINDPTIGTLQKGIYKIVLQGGGGGQGGYSGRSSCGKAQDGGWGFKGETEEKVFLVEEPFNFTAEIGGKGNKGGEANTNGCSYYCGCNGNNGGTTSFVSKKYNFSALGGRGGVGGCVTACNTYYSAGDNSSTSDTSKGFIKIYKYHM